MPKSQANNLRPQMLMTPRLDPGEELDLSAAVSLEQIAGDEKAIASIVDLLYRKLTTSSQLRSFFLGVDLERLRLHQSHFTMQLFSGAVATKLRTLRAVHKRLVKEMSLGEEDFNEFVKLGRLTLQEAKTPEPLIDEFENRINVLRSWILDLPASHRRMSLDEFFDLTRGG